VGGDVFAEVHQGFFGGEAVAVDGLPGLGQCLVGGDKEGCKFWSCGCC
jgi:hypothetical protein